MDVVLHRTIVGEVNNNHWVGLINNNLSEQLVNLDQSRKFYMRMCIVRILHNRLQMRLLVGAMKLLEYGAWLIQFPIFSYIRVH